MVQYMCMRFSVFFLLSRTANFSTKTDHVRWCNGCYSYDPLYAEKAESDNRNAIAWNGKVQSIDCIAFSKQFSMGWTNKNLFDLQKINCHTKDIKRRHTTYYTVRADEWNREKYLHYPITNFEHNRECTQNNVQQQRRWVCEWNGAEWTGADLLMNTTVYTVRYSSHDENCIYILIP